MFLKANGSNSFISGVFRATRPRYPSSRGRWVERFLPKSASGDLHRPNYNTSIQSVPSKVWHFVARTSSPNWRNGSPKWLISSCKKYLTFFVYEWICWWAILLAHQYWYITVYWYCFTLRISWTDFASSPRTLLQPADNIEVYGLYWSPEGLIN